MGRTRRLVPSKRLDGDGSNQAKSKAFVGTRDAKDRRLFDMERLVGRSPRRRR